MPSTGRRRLPALVLGVVAAAVIGLISVGSAVAVQADPPQVRHYEAIRKKIVSVANAENKKSDTHDHGNDTYPKRYRLTNVVYGVDWCGIFVNYVWTKGGATKRPSMKAPSSGKAKYQGHWATYWQKWGKDKSRWKPISKRNPRIGDAIVYGNWPNSHHVGIVVGVKYNKSGKATHVKTVEGNLSNTVKSPTYKNSTWRPIAKLTGGGTKASGFVSPVPVKY